MYPDQIFLGIDLYTVLLCAGIFAAILVFRVLADRIRLPVKLQNTAMIIGVGAIAVGSFSAVLFQALYNMKENSGRLVLDQNTGATFFGGLLGGAAVFLLVYFTAGKFLFPKGEHKQYFYPLADAAICAVTVSHALGRLGCLMAGCCHGRPTDAWFGIRMLIGGTWQKVVPTQLFEAIFLLCLFIWLLFRLLRRRGYCMELYMICYGVWRFLIEYLRSDDRGTTLIEFLTPSQLIAVLMVLGGIALVLVRKRLTGNRTEQKRSGEAQRWK